MKKDKEKVLDEVWTTARVRDFLDVQPAENIEADFHALLKAYQSMRAENFAEFVDFFVSDGRDIHARNPKGETVLEIISRHRNSGEYADILRKNGAGQ